MSTTVLNAYSKSYPAISNRIRASVARHSSPLAPIASIIDSTPGHPSRTWTFPGLPRDNYIFTLDVIDTQDNVIANLAYFDVVPGELDGYLTRNDEQVTVGITPGFNEGDNQFVFDGTEGKPNYIGWEIVPSELTGRGILNKSIDYSWDANTGTFTLLQPGDTFDDGVTYNIHFNPTAEAPGNSYPTITDFIPFVFTEESPILLEHFGNEVLCITGGASWTLSLPDIETVPYGRRLRITIGNSPSGCIRILPFGSDQILYKRDRLYILPNESLEISAFEVEPNVKKWVLSNLCGNFYRVGEVVDDYIGFQDSFNKAPLDGRILNNVANARLYYDVVMNLPPASVWEYRYWGAGGPGDFFRTRYSYANQYGDFHVPDLKNRFAIGSNNVNGSGEPLYSAIGSGGVSFTAFTSNKLVIL